VDILSRKAWAFPLKDHKMDTLLGAYKRFLREVGLARKPANVSARLSMVEGDNEWNAQAFRSYNAGMQIDTYVDTAEYDHITRDGDRLGIVDRLIGTLKRQLRLYFRLHAGTAGRWLAVLPQIITDYNATRHGTLERVYGVKGMTPDQAYGLDKGVQEARYADELAHNAQADGLKENRLMIGQRVRVLEYRGDRIGKDISTFWSKAFYRVARRDGYKWIVEGSDGRELDRRFKINELKRVSGAERQDEAGAKDVMKAKKAARVRRVMQQQEQIEPAQETPDETPTKEALEGKTLWDLQPKVGRWIAVDAEGADEDSTLLKFKKQGKACYVYVGKVSRLEQKGRRRTIKVRYLAAALPKHRTLTSRYLEPLSGDKGLRGSTSATALLYMGRMEFSASGKGSLPAEVAAKIKERYDAEAEPEQDQGSDADLEH
jgi:hypothetical protein